MDTNQKIAMYFGIAALLILMIWAPISLGTLFMIIALGVLVTLAQKYAPKSYLSPIFIVIGLYAIGSDIYESRYKGIGPMTDSAKMTAEAMRDITRSREILETPKVARTIYGRVDKEITSLEAQMEAISRDTSIPADSALSQLSVINKRVIELKRRGDAMVGEPTITDQVSRVISATSVQRDTLQQYYVEWRWAHMQTGTASKAFGPDIVIDQPFDLRYYNGDDVTTYGRIAGTPLTHGKGFAVAWNFPGKGSGTDTLMQSPIQPDLFVGSAPAVRKNGQIGELVTTIGRAPMVQVSSPTKRAFGTFFGGWEDFGVACFLFMALFYGTKKVKGLFAKPKPLPTSTPPAGGGKKK